MLYLLETKLSESDSVYHALQNIYGLNKATSFYLNRKLGFSFNLKIKDLSEDQVLKLSKLIEFSKLKLTSDLKKFRIFVTKRLVSIKSNRGLRKIRGLPIRGQRTHTNAKTSKKSNLFYNLK